jgi:hypothetical protein
MSEGDTIDMVWLDEGIDVGRPVAALAPLALR